MHESEHVARIGNDSDSLYRAGEGENVSQQILTGLRGEIADVDGMLVGIHDFGVEWWSIIGGTEWKWVNSRAKFETDGVLRLQCSQGELRNCASEMKAHSDFVDFSL